MKHTFLAEAAVELTDAVSFYEHRSAGLGAEFDQRVRRCIALIKESPERWPVTKSGARRCLVEGFPYAVRYLVKDDAIIIVAVAHGSRAPDYWRDRLA